MGKTGFLFKDLSCNALTLTVRIVVGVFDIFEVAFGGAEVMDVVSYLAAWF